MFLSLQYTVYQLVTNYINTNLTYRFLTFFNILFLGIKKALLETKRAKLKT